MPSIVTMNEKQYWAMRKECVKRGHKQMRRKFRERIKQAKKDKEISENCYYRLLKVIKELER